MAAYAAETRPLESSQIRKHFVNPPAASRIRDLIREQTTDRARSKSERLRSGSSELAGHASRNPGGLLTFGREVFRRTVPGVARQQQSADEVCVDKSRKGEGEGERVDTGEESGQIGGHTGKEVRVPRAGRRGGFAPVSPGGFIEPHTAWYGVPATVLYAMYQNAADPRPPWCRRRRRRSFANSLTPLWRHSSF